jgi:hypothetical protein
MACAPSENCVLAGYLLAIEDLEDFLVRKVRSPGNRNGKGDTSKVIQLSE